MTSSASLTRKALAVVLLSLICGTHVSAFTAPASLGFGLRGNAAFAPASPALRASPRAARAGLPVMKSTEDKSALQKQMAAALAAAMLSASPALAADQAPPAMVAPPAQQGAAAAPTAPAAPAKQAAAPGGVQNWRYSEFIEAVEKNKVEKVTFSADGRKLLAVDVDGNRFKLDALPQDPDLLNTLTVHKVDVTVLPAQQEGGAGDLIRSLIFPAILFGGLFLLSRGSQGGQGGPMGGMGGPMDLSRSGAKVQMQPDTGVTFADVVGVDGAKVELEEVVQFLKESDRFTELGARIPRGLILEGPPGTGKTLLARAVAGEAGVPFFSISGSEFVEMFVGVGASRVRDLFGQAKKNAPCIIFIDEIDAVGRQRGAGIAGGNDEREQTLNQILTEMDGFEGNPGIIVIAATNRADVLDPALLRPGRFDRRIVVDLPDFKGRVAILGVHSRGKPLGDDVDLEQVARRAPGFSGASLANLMNEAAIFAARKNKSTIGNEEISDALDRVMLGPEKKNAVSTVQKKELVAYHEAGHAVVGALIPDYDQVAKITIMPRGGAGGLTFFAPNEDRVDSGLYTRQFLEGQMAVALGGRIAEEIIFGDDEITTGASNDIQQVTNTAKMMVTRFGMSEKVGQVALAQDQGSPFMGRQMGSRQSSMSSETKALIDSEVSRLVNEAYTKAKAILVENREVLDKLAVLLVEKETVTAEEFAQLLTDSNVKIGSYGLYAS
eukprot:CAMPEP_0206230700 /NCGR_PEP_ID=MMETSP0047_2-20121206/10413_1 /ASSEMBLY_ACC=CAM_ASM_000192 /TAXON_ID=195065 /ORGANISM="Chroomonas mesostigmatica_cf, Strain CCMP1168" /LENGTH=722 /DNA_ID=CAMNT_0053654169 /DNA_START=54 /DNA_END=2222 /DNA_ORIENTATION=+